MNTAENLNDEFEALWEGSLGEGVRVAFDEANRVLEMLEESDDGDEEA